MSNNDFKDFKMNKRLTQFIIYGFAIFLFISISGANMFITINPGEKGILFKRFAGGLDKENIREQGFKVIAPWNKMYVYDVRIKESFANMEVLSKDGLTIKLELSYRYAPVPDKVGYLHDEIGPDYHERIITPEIRSVTREVIGKYLPEELYSSKREVIEDEIYLLTGDAISRKNLIMDAVLIRDVELPLTLKKAIEQKLTREQEVQEYEFKLLKEAKEAERKKIEADGIANFQKIVDKTITPTLLKWKGVEATQELAKSPNTKVVIVGNDSGEMPIILGGDN